MNYDEINVDEVLAEVDAAIEKGEYRQATKQESMKVRLAALAAIVRNMQEIVEQDHQMAVKERQTVNA
uniref:Uncharacterized protein n=1 Tax=uncultured bacterium contig00053 TaxID=1181537 RepID=A0A806KJX2_9BACT|nr:hypothetical protein [uncultured bacterium contig00053]